MKLQWPSFHTARHVHLILGEPLDICLTLIEIVMVSSQMHPKISLTVISRTSRRFNDSRLAAIEFCKLTGDARLTEKMNAWRPTSMPIQLSDMQRLSLSRTDQRRIFKMMETAWRKSGKTMTKNELWALAFDKSKKKRSELSILIRLFFFTQ